MSVKILSKSIASLVPFLGLALTVGVCSFAHFPRTSNKAAQCFIREGARLDGVGQSRSSSPKDVVFFFLVLCFSFVGC